MRPSYALFQFESVQNGDHVITTNVGAEVSVPAGVLDPLGYCSKISFEGSTKLIRFYHPELENTLATWGSEVEEATAGGYVTQGVLCHIVPVIH